MMSSTGRGTLRIPTSTGYIEFPSYTIPKSIPTKNLFGLADLTMNGCIIELTNTGTSIFDKTKTLIWFTPKEPSSIVWNLDLSIFQQTEKTTERSVLNPSGGSPVLNPSSIQQMPNV